MISKIWPRAGACIGAIALAACANPHWTPASAATESDVVVVRAYDGPVKPLSEVATVYAFDGHDTGDAQWICGVDGKDLAQRPSGLSVRCPSVVYLTPGRHVLGWRYHSRHWDRRYVAGSADLAVNVQAGRVYDLMADGVSQTTRTVARPPGFVLRYSDIRPGSFSDTPIPN